jgi:hypothetical protein
MVATPLSLTVHSLQAEYSGRNVPVAGLYEELTIPNRPRGDVQFVMIAIMGLVFWHIGFPLSVREWVVGACGRKKKLGGHAVVWFGGLRHDVAAVYAKDVFANILFSLRSERLSLLSLWRCFPSSTGWM